MLPFFPAARRGEPILPSRSTYTPAPGGQHGTQSGVHGSAAFPVTTRFEVFHDMCCCWGFWSLGISLPALDMHMDTRSSGGTAHWYRGWPPLHEEAHRHESEGIEGSHSHRYPQGGKVFADLPAEKTMVVASQSQTPRRLTA